MIEESSSRLHRGVQDVANDPAFSRGAFSRRVLPQHFPQAILALLVLAFCFPSASKADDIPVTVLFTNGDRLTGTLEGLSGAQIRFRPQAVHGLGNAINFDWQQDSLAELRAGPGCLYLKSLNDQPSNVCFQNAIIRSSGDNTVSITTEDGQTLSKVSWNVLHRASIPVVNTIGAISGSINHSFASGSSLRSSRMSVDFPPPGPPVRTIHWCVSMPPMSVANSCLLQMLHYCEIFWSPQGILRDISRPYGPENCLTGSIAPIHVSAPRD